YHKDHPDELVVIPWPKLEKLQFSVLGGQPDTTVERERGPRPYGHAWRENGSLDEGTGVCLEKSYLRNAFAETAGGTSGGDLARADATVPAEAERGKATIREAVLVGPPAPGREAQAPSMA